jgi:hypothetical protein
MKIIFIPIEDGFQIRSMCEDHEVSGAVETIKEKSGEDTEIYALDCPGFTFTVADIADDGGAALTERAAALVMAAMKKAGLEQDYSGLEILNGPDDEEEEKEPPTRGPDIVPVTYVIFRADTNDYLSYFEESGDERDMQWYTYPDKAIRYKTAKEAEKKARHIVEDGYYTLTVCELHETEKQFWTRALTDHSQPGISLN